FPGADTRVAHSPDETDGAGHKIAAAASSTQYHDSVLFQVEYFWPNFKTVSRPDGTLASQSLDTGTWLLAHATPTVTVSNGGTVLATEQYGDDLWRTFVRTGSTPGPNDVHVDANNVHAWVHVQDPNTGVWKMILVDFADASADIKRIWGVDA